MSERFFGMLERGSFIEGEVIVRTGKRKKGKGCRNKGREPGSKNSWRRRLRGNKGKMVKAMFKGRLSRIALFFPQNQSEGDSNNS